MHTGRDGEQAEVRDIGSMAVAVAAVVALPAVAARAGDDPGTRVQWGLTQVGAPEAWTRTTGAGVRIGIVDTGVDLAHKDLLGKVVAETSCVGSAGDAAACRGSGQDDNGHGTHVAGIAAVSS